MKGVEDLIKNAKLAIFDFDGTLFSIDVDWDRMYDALTDVGRLNGFIGRFSSLVEAYEWSRKIYRARESLIEVQSELEIEGIHGRKIIDQGASAAKWRLSRDLPCSILSLNTYEIVDRILGHWGFFPIITIDKVGRIKPHPEGLELILRTKMVFSGEAVFIGNSDMDLSCAEAGNVPFVHVDDIREEWFG